MADISKINLSGTDYTLNASTITDYGNNAKKIQVGFVGAGLTASTLGYVAGYTTDGTKIKNVSKNNLQSWLGLGSAAYANLTDFDYRKKVILDLQGDDYDVDTYYLLCFTLRNTIDNGIYIEGVELKQTNIWGNSRPSKTFWANLEVHCIPNGWGARSYYWQDVYHCGYDWCDMNPFKKLNQLEQANLEYVYLRGGALYYAYINANNSATLYPSGYTDTLSGISLNGSYAKTDSALTNIVPTKTGNLTLTGILTANTFQSNSGGFIAPVKGSNPRTTYSSSMVFYNCNPDTTSAYNFGVYQWDSEFQFNYRNSSTNAFLGNSFTIRGADGLFCIIKRPKIGSYTGYDVLHSGDITGGGSVGGSSLTVYNKTLTIPTSLKNPTSLILKLNGGTTEGTNLFTYDGSTAKTVNITPNGIGAAASSHTHNYASTVKIGSDSYSVSSNVISLPAYPTAATLGLSSAMKFIGTTTTALTDGSTTNPITINNTSVTATSGNVVLYGNKEFLWNTSAWEELGDESSYALKTVSINAGTGLSGGGTLEANRTLTLNAATSTTLGGIKTGYTTSGKNYKVQLDSSNNAYVNVPWTDINTNQTVKGNGTAFGSTAAVDIVGGGATSVTADTTNNKITISSTNTTYTAGTNVTISGTTINAKDTTYSTFGGASASATGTSGLVPAPAAGKNTSFLRGDGTWVIPTNTTYSVATTSANGLMSASDKSKLDGIAAGANNYTLPIATSSVLGGVKSVTTGTTANRYYNVQVNSDGTMKVNVPWVNTTYDLSGYATQTWVTDKGYTTNAGTVTSVAVKMNGTVKGTITSSGTIDLGTVLTAHQDISSKADKASITAGTAGTSSATSGSTLAVPYVTVNTQGIVTGYGTHTHTINGFAASSHTHDDRYYTETEIDTKLSAKQNASTAVTHTANTAVGSSTQPVFINSSGVATAIGYTIAKSVPANAIFTDTNTTYSAGTSLSLSGTTFNHATISSTDTTTERTYNLGDTITYISGLNFDGCGHPTTVTFEKSTLAIGLAATNTTGLVKTTSTVTSNSGYTACPIISGVPYYKDTDTHYASSTIVAKTATATTNASASITNGNVYLNHIENGAVKSSHLIKGTGATTVTANSSNQIIINSTNTNTTYSADNNLIRLNGTTFKGNNSVTATFTSPLTSATYDLGEHLSLLTTADSNGDTPLDITYRSGVTDLFLVATITGLPIGKLNSINTTIGIGNQIIAITQWLNEVHANSGFLPDRFTIHFYLAGTSNILAETPVLIGFSDDFTTYNIIMTTTNNQWTPGYYKITFNFINVNNTHYISGVLKSGTVLGNSSRRYWQTNIECVSKM